MDLNHIELPPTLLADLYRDLLVLEDASPAPISPAPEIPVSTGAGVPKISRNKWPSLGENRQQVLVVTAYPDAFHLPDSDLTFLTKILGACKLSLADVAIINLNNYDASTYSGIADHFSSKIVLLFGIEPLHFALPISFPHFQVQAHRKVTYLFTPTLQELEKNAVLKSRSWVCLKQIFNI